MESALYISNPMYHLVVTFFCFYIKKTKEHVVLTEDMRGDKSTSITALDPKDQ